jgi:hypothetical protein
MEIRPELRKSQCQNRKGVNNIITTMQSSKADCRLLLFCKFEWLCHDVWSIEINGGIKSAEIPPSAMAALMLWGYVLHR